VPSLKELIKGDPIHSRMLDFKTYPLDEERVIVAGKLKDERLLPFYDEAGQLAKGGVIHEMLLYLLIGGMPLIILRQMWSARSLAICVPRPGEHQEDCRAGDQERFQ
jgi:hypothetical protein